MKKIIVVLLLIVTVVAIAYIKYQSKGMVVGQNYQQLTNEKVRIFYSEGYENLANEHLERLTDMWIYYNERLNFKERVDVYVLNREDFTVEFGDELPYGMPFHISMEHTKSNPIIVTPATNDGVVTSESLKNVDVLSSTAKDYFRKAGVLDEEGIIQHTHLLATHEFGHAVVDSMKLNKLGHWFNETLANYCTIAYLEDCRPNLALIWYGNMYLVDAGKEEQNYTTLEEFDSQYGDINTVNYVWYQNQFSITCKDINDQLGYEFLIKVGDKLSTKTISNPQEVLKELEEITNVLSRKWQKN